MTSTLKPKLWNHLLWPGIKGSVPFLTTALPHLTTAVHPSMFSHHFIVCQRINKSHPLGPRKGCIPENCEPSSQISAFPTAGSHSYCKP